MSDSLASFSRRGTLAVMAAAAGGAVLSLGGAYPVNASRSDASLPRPSDVIFSSRWMLPESIPLAAAVGATRFDWTYSERTDFYAAIKAAGIPEAGGAINMFPPDRTGQSTYRIGRQHDRFGRPIEAPWMKGKGWYWGCVNNPAFVGLQVGRARSVLQAGTLTLQYDDAACSIPAVAWGGCWCAHCRQAASKGGYDLATQMRPFQTASTISFIKTLRSSINAASGRDVTMSCNNFRLRMDVPFPLFDFGMCEIEPADAALQVLEPAYRQFERDGWMQVVTLRSGDSALNRAAIARVHALGGAMIYPYNVYMADGSRATASAADVVPLYQYVRAIGMLLDASLFTRQTVSDFLTADSIAALTRARVETIVRKAGDKTVLHFIPTDYQRAFQAVPIRLAGTAGVASLLRSAELPYPRAVEDGRFAIAPWDWSTLTFEA